MPFRGGTVWIRNRGRLRRKEMYQLTGTSKIIKNTLGLIADYSTVYEPLLITGETGTGKNHAAQFIHHLSRRKGKFVVINTPSIPGNLFESELFGHKKGAFTNAHCDKKGLIEEAAGGTLVIDEISEVSTALQAKLLRFIETGRYTRLGETFEKKIDVRIIATTNRDLNDAMENKEFREDLYFRLSVFEIEMPPLRTRKEDIKDLVQENAHLLGGKKLGQRAWEALYNYDWPGNVRELISVLKRAGILAKTIITARDLKKVLNGGYRNRDNGVEKHGGEPIWNEFRKGKNFWEAVKEPYMDRELNRTEVKGVLYRGLLETNGRYIDLMTIFNLEKNEYHRFMRFLHDQELIPARTRASKSTV
jgi:DNA-binding NtrC family response regulator